MSFICLVTLREDVSYSLCGPECSNMAEKLKNVFFQNTNPLPAKVKPPAGKARTPCRQNWNPMPAKLEPHAGKTRTPLGKFWKKKHFFLVFLPYLSTQDRENYTRHLN